MGGTGTTHPLTPKVGILPGCGPLPSSEQGGHGTPRTAAEQLAQRWVMQ